MRKEQKINLSFQDKDHHRCGGSGHVRQYGYRILYYSLGSYDGSGMRQSILENDYNMNYLYEEGGFSAL